MRRAQRTFMPTATQMTTGAPWTTTATTSGNANAVPVPLPAPPLEGVHEVDVAVVGSGITGLTTAHLLATGGLKVALLERRQLGEGETGRTTAHLTEILDTRYHVLRHRFGDEGAQLMAWGQRLAIDSIRTLIDQWSIPADFSSVPGYLYAETDAQVDDLKSELEACKTLGIAASWSTDCPLPTRTMGALKVENQAQFNPGPYLQALARAFVEEGGLFFENTPVTRVEDGAPCRVHTPNGSVLAQSVVLATHVPFSSRVLLQTKLAAYRTYAVAAPLVGPMADGLFWDTQDPYHYIRTHRIDETPHLIVGGEDHRVGAEEGEEPQAFAKLEAYVKERFRDRVLTPTFRWSGQILESVDGLPFVGKDAGAEHIFVSTGYAGNGITLGTLAGVVLADLVRGLENPWRELLEATRVKPLASAKAFVAENMAFPKHFLLDHLKRARSKDTLASLARGQGDVFRVQKERLAVYRGEDGQLSACSAICPHLGCLVHWNPSEKSWDCPCHGSRFAPDGKVLNGPASSPLAAKPAPQE